MWSPCCSEFWMIVLHIGIFYPTQFAAERSHLAAIPARSLASFWISLLAQPRPQGCGTRGNSTRSGQSGGLWPCARHVCLIGFMASWSLGLCFSYLQGHTALMCERGTCGLSYAAPHRSCRCFDEFYKVVATRDGNVAWFLSREQGQPRP
jgi:hypothetical protein